MAERVAEKMRIQVMDWRNTSFASLFFFAPIKCATCTLKPAVAALQMPLKSHSDAATKPIEAESLAPNCPTIDASIYCMMIDESCTIMAGTLNRAARWSCCVRVTGVPFLIFANNMSFFDSFISAAKFAKICYTAKGNRPLYSILSILVYIISKKEKASRCARPFQYAI